MSIPPEDHEPEIYDSDDALLRALGLRHDRGPQYVTRSTTHIRATNTVQFPDGTSVTFGHGPFPVIAHQQSFSARLTPDQTLQALHLLGCNVIEAPGPWNGGGRLFVLHNGRRQSICCVWVLPRSLATSHITIGGDPATYPLFSMAEVDHLVGELQRVMDRDHPSNHSDPPARPLSDADWVAMLTWWDTHEPRSTNKDIANHYGFALSTIKNQRTRLKVPKRSTKSTK